MPKYVVEFRQAYYNDDDIYVVNETVEADSMHQAIGIAFPLMQKEVEEYDGTIDDLDAWMIKDDDKEKKRLAKNIYTLATGRVWIQATDKEYDLYMQIADMIMKENR